MLFLKIILRYLEFPSDLLTIFGGSFYAFYYKDIAVKLLKFMDNNH